MSEEKFDIKQAITEFNTEFPKLHDKVIFIDPSDYCGQNVKDIGKAIKKQLGFKNIVLNESNAFQALCTAGLAIAVPYGALGMGIGQTYTAYKYNKKQIESAAQHISIAGVADQIKPTSPLRETYKTTTAHKIGGGHIVVSGTKSDQTPKETEFEFQLAMGEILASKPLSRSFIANPNDIKTMTETAAQIYAQMKFAKKYNEFFEGSYFERPTTTKFKEAFSATSFKVCPNEDIPGMAVKEALTQTKLENTVRRPRRKNLTR